MRKSAIIAVLCLPLFTGCGKIDSDIKESDGAETTVAVENNTEIPTKEMVSSLVSTISESKLTTTNTNTSTKATTTTSTIIVRGGGTTLTVPKRTGTSDKTTTRATTISTLATTTTAVEVTTTSVEPYHNIFTKENLECKVTREGIDISLNNDKIQTIDIDTEELIEALSDVKTENKAQIVIDDIDLDGHDDLFIPQQVRTLNTFGVYYHFDTEENKYVKWEALKDIDSCAKVNEMNKTFTTEVKLSDDEYEIKVFSWNYAEPVIQSLKKQYHSSDNKDELLIDYFDYSSGEEQLVKRERVLFDSDGREVGAEEIEIV